jgi:hypothetical protein
MISENTHQVIHNSDTIYKSDVKWIDTFEPTPPTEYEKEMLKNTRTPDDILKEEEQNSNVLDDEIKRQKDYINKVKVIALDIMGKHPLTNPSFMSIIKKNELIAIMREVMTRSEEDITTVFNNICLEKVLNPTADYTSYRIHKSVKIP